MSTKREDYTFVDRHDELLVKRPGEIAGQGFVLERLKNCEVYLLDYTGQVQIDDCFNCRILIGPCDGSVFLRDCSDCFVGAACRQLRTRDCKTITFSLYCATQPSIETSKGLVFTCWKFAYPDLTRHFKAARLDPNCNSWNKVYDFNAMGSASGRQNPHYQVDKHTYPFICVPLVKDGEVDDDVLPSNPVPNSNGARCNPLALEPSRVPLAAADVTNIAAAPAFSLWPVKLPPVETQMPVAEGADAKGVSSTPQDDVALTQPPTPGTPATPEADGFVLVKGAGDLKPKAADGRLGVDSLCGKSSESDGEGPFLPAYPTQAALTAASTQPSRLGKQSSDGGKHELVAQDDACDEGLGQEKKNSVGPLGSAAESASDSAVASASEVVPPSAVVHHVGREQDESPFGGSHSTEFSAADSTFSAAEVSSRTSNDFLKVNLPSDLHGDDVSFDSPLAGHEPNTSAENKSMDVFVNENYGLQSFSAAEGGQGQSLVAFTATSPDHPFVQQVKHGAATTPAEQTPGRSSKAAPGSVSLYVVDCSGRDVGSAVFTRNETPSVVMKNLDVSDMTPPLQSLPQVDTTMGVDVFVNENYGQQSFSTDPDHRPAPKELPATSDHPAFVQKVNHGSADVAARQSASAELTGGDVAEQVSVFVVDYQGRDVGSSVFSRAEEQSVVLKKPDLSAALEPREDSHAAAQNSSGMFDQAEQDAAVPAARDFMQEGGVEKFEPSSNSHVQETEVGESTDMYYSVYSTVESGVDGVGQGLEEEDAFTFVDMVPRASQDSVDTGVVSTLASEPRRSTSDSDQLGVAADASIQYDEVMIQSIQSEPDLAADCAAHHAAVDCTAEFAADCTAGPAADCTAGPAADGVAAVPSVQDCQVPQMYQAGDVDRALDADDHDADGDVSGTFGQQGPELQPHTGRASGGTLHYDSGDGAKDEEAQHALEDGRVGEEAYESAESHGSHVVGAAHAVVAGQQGLGASEVAMRSMKAVKLAHHDESFEVEDDADDGAVSDGEVGVVRPCRFASYDSGAVAAGSPATYAVQQVSATERDKAAQAGGADAVQAGSTDAAQQPDSQITQAGPIDPGVVEEVAAIYDQPDLDDAVFNGHSRAQQGHLPESPGISAANSRCVGANAQHGGEQQGGCFKGPIPTRAISDISDLSDSELDASTAAVGSRSGTVRSSMSAVTEPYTLRSSIGSAAEPYTLRASQVHARLAGIEHELHQPVLPLPIPPKSALSRRVSTPDTRRNSTSHRVSFVDEVLMTSSTAAADAKSPSRGDLTPRARDPTTPTISATSTVSEADWDEFCTSRTSSQIQLGHLRSTSLDGCVPPATDTSFPATSPGGPAALAESGWQPSCTYPKAVNAADVAAPMHTLTTTPAIILHPPVSPQLFAAPAIILHPPVSPQPSAAPAIILHPPVSPQPFAAPAIILHPPVNPQPRNITSQRSTSRESSTTLGQAFPATNSLNASFTPSSAAVSHVNTTPSAAPAPPADGGATSAAWDLRRKPSLSKPMGVPMRRSSDGAQVVAPAAVAPSPAVAAFPTGLPVSVLRAMGGGGASTPPISAAVEEEEEPETWEVLGDDSDARLAWVQKNARALCKRSNFEAALRMQAKETAKIYIANFKQARVETIAQRLQAARQEEQQQRAANTRQHVPSLCNLTASKQTAKLERMREVMARMFA